MKSLGKNFFNIDLTSYVYFEFLILGVNYLTSSLSLLFKTLNSYGYISIYICLIITKFKP